MSADSIHRAGRLKMKCIAANRDFTTESSTLTFILAPFDMTWRAGLEQSPLQHPPTSAPAHQCLCRAPFSLLWEWRRSYTSWGSLLQGGRFLGQMLSWWMEAVLLPCPDWGDLVTDHSHQCKPGGLGKIHLGKKPGGVRKSSPPPGYFALWQWTRVTPLTLVKFPWFTWQ